jgi:hypothetical protein
VRLHLHSYGSSPQRKHFTHAHPKVIPQHFGGGRAAAAPMGKGVPAEVPMGKGVPAEVPMGRGSRSHVQSMGFLPQTTCAAQVQSTKRSPQE